MVRRTAILRTDVAAVAPVPDPSAPAPPPRPLPWARSPWRRWRCWSSRWGCSPGIEGPPRSPARQLSWAARTPPAPASARSRWGGPATPGRRPPRAPAPGRPGRARSTGRTLRHAEHAAGRSFPATQPSGSATAPPTSRPAHPGPTAGPRRRPPPSPRPRPDPGSRRVRQKQFGGNEAAPYSVDGTEPFRSIRNAGVVEIDDDHEEAGARPGTARASRGARGRDPRRRARRCSLEVGYDRLTMDAVAERGPGAQGHPLPPLGDARPAWSSTRCPRQGGAAHRRRTTPATCAVTCSRRSAATGASPTRPPRCSAR